MMTITIHTDGGSRGNPGPAGIGVVMRMHDGSIQEYNKYIGNATNNEAEYQAVIFALSLAQQQYRDQEKTINLKMFVDSELLYKQIIGAYRVKHPHMRPLYDQVVKLIPLFQSVTFFHVRREFNKEADRLVNQVLDKQGK